MPAIEADDALARWAASQESSGLLERAHACAAALQALEVARLDLQVGCAQAEDTIRHIAHHFRRFGRRSSLLAFEAWGIQLESAPVAVLAEQAGAAVTGLRRVLALAGGVDTLGARCVLILEPEAGEARRLQAALTGPRRTVLVARRLDEARMVCRTQVVDVVLVDVQALPAGGRELISETRERMDRTCVVVLTPNDDPSLQAECYALGADLCFPAPANAQVVATAVATQLDRAVRAEEVAVRDNLTGLVNRAGFEEGHRRACAEADRYDEPLSLAMLDLDHFKEVNDRFGHPAGDRVLLGVATILEDRFREADVVARWGGEEFAVLLPRTASTGAVEAVRAVLRHLGERRFRGPGGAHLPPVTFSAGVADGRGRLQKAVADADRRLYRAKAAGRGRVEGPGGI